MDEDEDEDGDVDSEDLAGSDASFEDQSEGDDEGAVPNKFVSFKGVKKFASGKPQQPEEAKSVFTDYSMTSSILPRSECTSIARVSFGYLVKQPSIVVQPSLPTLNRVTF